MFQRLVNGPNRHRSRWIENELLDTDFLDDEREETPFVWAEQLEALRPLTHNNPQN